MANAFLPDESGQDLDVLLQTSPRHPGNSEAQQCVRRFSAEGAVGDTRHHHVLEKADTHRHVTHNFVLSVQALKTKKCAVTQPSGHIPRLCLRTNERGITGCRCNHLDP